MRQPTEPESLPAARWPVRREGAWNSRHATAQEFQWFRNLIDLHALTLAWLKELKPGRDLDLIRQELDRSPDEQLEAPSVLRMSDLLASLSEDEEGAPRGPGFHLTLETVLGDSYPDEFLARMEDAVWTLQARLTSQLQGRVARPRLEEISCAAGRRCGEERWPSLDAWVRSDVRGAFFALQHSPLAGYPREEGFLPLRGTSSQVWVELRACPHRLHFPAVRASADELCGLQGHWIRGFLASVNAKIGVDHETRPQACRMRWFFKS